MLSVIPVFPDPLPTGNYQETYGALVTLRTVLLFEAVASAVEDSVEMAEEVVPGKLPFWTVQGSL